MTKCLKCGYENRDEAAHCDMCKELLQKNKGDKQTLLNEYENLRIQISTRNEPKFLLKLGDICLELGQKEEAIMYYGRVLLIEHGQPEAVRKVRTICSEKELKNIKFLQQDEHLFKIKENKLSLKNIKYLFKYPLRKEGYFLILGGALFLQLPILNWIMPWLIIPYCLSVVHSSGIGKDFLPEWADFSDIWGDIIGPNLQFDGVILIPVILYFFSPELRVLIVTASIFYYPMAIMLLAMQESFYEAINPFRVIVSIIKIWKKYLVTTGLFYALFYMGAFISDIFGWIPFFGGYIWHIILLYFALMGFRVIGLLYFDSSKELGW